MINAPLTFFPLVWDSTMRDTFAVCPQKFYWNYVRRLSPSEDSIDLTFGKAFAAGLEGVRKAYFAEGLSETYALVEGLRELLASWGDYPPEGNGVKTLESCVDALASYFTRYPLDTDCIRPFFDAKGKPAIEYTFALPIPVEHNGVPIVYAGKFDMLGEFNRELWVVDEKTTSQISSRWSTSWDLRGQFIGYTWAAQQFGHPVVGAIIRGVGIYKVSPIRHVDAVVQYPSHLIHSWYHQLVDDVSRALEMYRAERWPKAFGTPCMAYGRCPYDTLCTKQNPEAWVVGNYVENKWSPLGNPAK